MQKIALYRGSSFVCMEDELLKILDEVYGKHTFEEWFDIFYKKEGEGLKNIRTNEKFHKFMEDRNFIIRKVEYSNVTECHYIKIVEIPDNVEWKIQDGMLDGYEEFGEYIVEIHRTWG